MSSAGTPIRPRLRGAVPPSGHPAAAPQQGESVERTSPPMPELTVLARLAHVGPPPDRAKLALRLDWLTALDWKRMRRMHLDPNWVAGGVLCLVLFLLLLITLNRGSKTSEAPADADAPIWKNASAAAPVHPAATPAPKAADVALAPADAAPAANGGVLAAAISPDASGSQASNTYVAQISPSPANDFNQPQRAGGVYYPRTPYPAPDMRLVQAVKPAAAYPSHVSPPDETIRTAQREPLAPYPAANQVLPAAQPASRGAQFDGVITQPQRN